MTVAREMLILLIAVIGLLFANPAIGARLCPQQRSMMTMMHHHQQSAPGNRDAQACPACLAVLPAPAPVESAAIAPTTHYSVLFTSLSGVDPGLDPPPPRGG